MIVLVPMLMAVLMGINRHYREIAAALAIDHVPDAEEVSAGRS